MNCSYAQHELSNFFQDLPETCRQHIYVLSPGKTKTKYPEAKLERTESGRYSFTSNGKNVGAELVVDVEYTSLAFLKCSNDTFLVEGELVAFINPLPKICKDAVFTQGMPVPSEVLVNPDLPVAMGYVPRVLFDGNIFLDVKGSFYRKCFQVDEDHYLCLDVNAGTGKNYISCTYLLDFKNEEISIETIDQETREMNFEKYSFSGELILSMDKQ